MAPALAGDVDAVIHGGDLLYRSKVPARLVQMAFEPLLRVATAGTPVYLVPGNHERSAIPYRILGTHPNIFIFRDPRTFLLEKDGVRLALAGFPYVRDNIRGQFPRVLEETGWRQVEADACILCMHHCVEGATLIMGPRLFTFRGNSDVIRTRDIPPEILAVLTGHIHRFQVLTRDLQNRPLKTPVFYPGSVERTSFTEKDEEKGYLTFEIQRRPTTQGNAQGNTQSNTQSNTRSNEAKRKKGVIKQWRFHRLPARPMHEMVLRAEGMTGDALEKWLKEALSRAPENSVVKIRVLGKPGPGGLEVFKASSIRSLGSPGLNVEVVLADFRQSRRRR